MRAEQLAERGSGDALIRDDLERRGVAAEVVEARARCARARAGAGGADRGTARPHAKTARYLASRGFGEDALDGIVAAED